MNCNHLIEVPLRPGGGKKMKKRKELDALIAHSLIKRGSRRTINSQDKLLSVSTDELDDFAWMSVASIRRNHRKHIFARKCGPLFFGITTAFLVTILYWFYFDLRQQILEFHQKFEEVSAASRVFPDTLQHWHETTSFLMKNQSFVLYQLNDLTRNAQLLTSNLSNLQAEVNGQRNYGQDEKLVANFGAKLESAITDIDAMKEHYNKYADLQKKLELDAEILKANISRLSTYQDNFLPTNFTKDVNYFEETIENLRKNLDNKIMFVNNTLGQKIQILHAKILAHNTKLEDLLDHFQNITSHVATLSNSWLQVTQRMIIVEEQLNNLNEKLSLSEKIPDISVEHLMVLCKQHVEVLKESINHGKQITTIKPNNSSEQSLLKSSNISLLLTG